MKLAEKIRKEILSLPGVVEKKGRYGSRRAYFVKGHEFCHFHSDRHIDMRRTAAVDAKDSRVEPNPYTEKWVVFNFAREKDVKVLLKLIKAAYEETKKR